MAPGNAKCRQIVRTIPGQSTGGDDDRYVCADGSVWRKASQSEIDGTCTTVSVLAHRHNGHICDHK